MTYFAGLDNLSRNWEGWHLPKLLVGDASAAFLSATAISPIITAIDRAVVESINSNTHSLSHFLKASIIRSVRHPRAFIIGRPFFYVWTLYAVTYSTANTVESVGRSLASSPNNILLDTTTFLATCIVNVPLGVWKDVRFVQTYSHCTSSQSAHTKTMPKRACRNDPKLPPTLPKFPRTVAGIFLCRDAVTILGSFTLPHMVVESLPLTFLTDSVTRMAAAQIMVPVLSQVVATPVHLLGLDLYTHPHGAKNQERAQRIRRNLLSTTLVRCARIVPAFGVGGILNTGLRGWFHEKC